MKDIAAAHADQLEQLGLQRDEEKARVAELEQLVESLRSQLARETRAADVYKRCIIEGVEKELFAQKLNR